MSFSVIVPTNTAGRASTASRSPPTPLKPPLPLPGMLPEASIGVQSALRSRQRPMASKFSIESPAGSISR